MEEHKDLWVRGEAYPGATGDVFADGLYQGVVYETGSLTNLYDKYPGPGDDNADQPIDVDMDAITLSASNFPRNQVAVAAVLRQLVAAAAPSKLSVYKCLRKLVAVVAVVPSKPFA